MKLLMDRKFLNETYTISYFYINGKQVCEIVEDKVRDLNKDGDLLDDGETKIPKETAIPYSPSGKPYKVILSMSPTFKRILPLVVGVKHFTWIRIHKGRTAENSHGCLIPGENKIKGGVINSEKYEMLIIERILEALLRGEEVTLEII